MTENFWIGNDQYIIKYANGTHELVKFTEVNYEEYEREVIATGKYEDLREMVENERIAYLESLL